MIYQGPAIPSGTLAYNEARAVLYDRIAYGWRTIASMRTHCAPHRFNQASVDAANEMARLADQIAVALRREPSPPCVMVMPSDGGDPFREPKVR